MASTRLEQPSPEQTSTRRTALQVALSCAVLLTAVNGVIVGYGVIWFQLMGSTPDAEDYAVSTGGYGAAALVLAVAVPALLGHRAPAWLVWTAGVGAALLTVLALTSAGSWQSMETDPRPISTVWDGVGGVLWAPWTWLLLVLGVRQAWVQIRVRWKLA